MKKTAARRVTARHQGRRDKPKLAPTAGVDGLCSLMGQGGCSSWVSTPWGCLCSLRARLALDGVRINVFVASMTVAQLSAVLAAEF